MRTADDDDDDSASDHARSTIQQRSAALWARIMQHDQCTGLLLSSLLLVIFWMSFKVCTICILCVFIVSALLCMRLPWMYIPFWTSFIVLIFNSRALRGVHMKVDVPVGESMDNLLRPIVG